MAAGGLKRVATSRRYLAPAGASHKWQETRLEDGQLWATSSINDDASPTTMRECDAGCTVRFLGALLDNNAVVAMCEHADPQSRRYSSGSLEETGRWQLPEGTVDAAVDRNSLYVLTKANELAVFQLGASGPPIPMGHVVLPWPSESVRAGGEYVALSGSDETRVLRRTDEDW